MTLKPRDLAVWGTSVAALTAEPTYAQQLPGHLEANRPSPYWQNWWQRLMHSWANYYDKAKDDLGGNAIQEMSLWGPGTDGDVSITGDVRTSRDMFYRNLTFQPGGFIVALGRIFVSDTLDMTYADAGALSLGGLDGGVLCDVPTPGYRGVTGIGGAPAALTGYLGGLSGGAGGRGGGGTIAANNGASGGSATIGGPGVFSPDEPLLAQAFAYFGGAPGSGGGAGGPVNDSHARGGAGQPGGGLLFISARKLRRDVQLTGEGAINASGYDGGDGEGVEGVTGGGGGGGGGGSGGCVFIRTNELLGSGKVGMIDVSGGDGGSGGTASDGGWSDGIGGVGGSAGVVLYWNTQTPSFTSLTGGAGGGPTSELPDDPDVVLRIGGAGASLLGDL